MPYSASLQAILADFASKVVNGTNSSAYKAITTALDSSWTLFSHMEQCVALGTLTALVPLFNNTNNVGASYGDGKISIPVTGLGDLSSGGTLAQFILMLGHEVHHAELSPDLSRGWTTFLNGVNDLAARPGFQDYTQLLLVSQNLHALDEAESQIAGWNAMIGYANSHGLNTSAAAIRAMGGNFSSYVMAADSSPVEGLHFNSDYSISLTAANVAAVVMTYFLNPNSRFAFNLTYPEVYASGELDYIFQKANGDKIAVDLNLLHIDPVRLQSANPFHLAEGKSVKIYDPITYETHTFQSNGAGVTRVNSRPITLEGGDKTEERIYNADGLLVSTDHAWTKSDGSSGSDTLDAAGNFYERTQSATGATQFSFVNATGDHGSGYKTIDGTTHNETFRADGTYSINTYYADGSYEYSWKNSGGVTARGFKRENENNSETYNKDGSYSIFSKDADGVNTSIVHNADGTYREATNRRDGTFSISTLDAKGTKSNEELTVDHDYTRTTENADGSKEKFSQASDGMTTKETTDVAGNVLWEQIVYNVSMSKKYTGIDGSHWHSERTATSSVSEGVNSDGSYFKFLLTTIDKNHSVAESWETYANGDTVATLADLYPNASGTVFPGRDYRTTYNATTKQTITNKTELDGSATKEIAGDGYSYYTSFGTHHEILLEKGFNNGQSNNGYAYHYDRELLASGAYHQVTVADCEPFGPNYFNAFTESQTEVDGTISGHTIAYQGGYIWEETYYTGNIHGNIHTVKSQLDKDGNIVTTEEDGMWEISSIALIGQSQETLSLTGL